MSRTIVFAGSALLLCGVAFAAPAPAPKSAGERAFMKCVACHSVDPKAKPMIGPNLYQVLGRKIASAPGFKYSPAMRDFAKTNPRWTAALVDRLVTNPKKLVPGSTMAFPGMSDAKERRALTDYLAAAGRSVPR
jgi:cytochrome c